MFNGLVCGTNFGFMSKNGYYFTGWYLYEDGDDDRVDEETDLSKVYMREDAFEAFEAAALK